MIDQSFVEYIERFLDSQEDWVRKLFSRRKAQFLVDVETGNLMVQFKKTVPELKQTIVSSRLAKYFNETPHESFVKSIH